MSYTGVYDKTIFYNPATKYCVISVKTSDRSIPEKARSAYRHRDHLIRFAAVGYELPRTEQISMILTGEWKDGKNGCQLHVSECEEIVPQTKEGVQGYLASRLIKGVGEKTAEAIVDRFGVDALNILEKEPERLLEIKGITEAKLAGIKTSYLESRTLRDLMILLSPFKVTPAAATKIYDHFGAKSVDILRDNPFELCQVSGFGFKRVDAIVLKNNWPLNSPMRIQGAIYSALDTERNENGHLYLDTDELMKAAMTLLNDKIPLPQMRVKPGEVEPVVQDMLLRGRLICSNGSYYQRFTFIQEDETAMKIAKIISEPMPRADIRGTLDSVRKKLGVELSQRQTEAVYMAFRHNLSIITGSPGTGKTTVLKAVIEVFRQLNANGKLLLAAPTGRASRRMAESTGIDEAKTGHGGLGLLGEEGSFRRDRQEPLDADLIIVDETSMMDMWLARQFFLRVKEGAKVVLVGDADQLQSVGAGDVFRELIRCGLIPVTTLNEIFRQKKDSLIAYNAKKINEDDTDFYYGSDFHVCKCKTPEEAAAHIQSIYYEQIEQYGTERVQILSPFRSTGEAAVEPLNEVIREAVNPQREEIPDLKIGGMFFRVGDKVMQNKNSDKASNGDIGFIRGITRTEKNELKITISFSGDREVEYGLEQMEHMELAYATTVHKAQGSEFDVVIFPIIKSHARMLTRSLVYTAITRAKRKVILVGQIGMLFMAVHKNDTGKRNTQLGKRIGLYAKAFAVKDVLDSSSEYEQLKKIS